MARSYDGGTNYIRCDVGACAAAGTGAYTLISLFKVPLFTSATGLFSLRRSTTFARYALVTGSKLFGQGDFSSGFGTIDDDAWIWAVERKAAGNAHYEMAYALYPVVDPNTDIVFGEAPDAANHSDPGAGDEIWLGETDLHGRGDQALHALFTSRLSDAQIKAGLTAALSDLIALGPAGCWPLNQADPADRVLDVTGNGADQLLVGGVPVTVGTVGVSTDPPGYDFNLGATINLTGTGTVGGLTGTAQMTRQVSLTAAGTVGGLTGTAIVRNPADAVITGDLRAHIARSGLATSQTGSVLTASQTRSHMSTST